MHSKLSYFYGKFGQQAIEMHSYNNLTESLDCEIQEKTLLSPFHLHLHDNTLRNALSFRIIFICYCNVYWAICSFQISNCWCGLFMWIGMKQNETVAFICTCTNIGFMCIIIPSSRAPTIEHIILKCVMLATLHRNIDSRSNFQYSGWNMNI